MEIQQKKFTYVCCIGMNLKKIQCLMNKYGLVYPIRKVNPYQRIAKTIKTNKVVEDILNQEIY